MKKRRLKKWVKNLIVILVLYFMGLGTLFIGLFGYINALN